MVLSVCAGHLLEKAQEDSCDTEASEVLYKSSAHHDNAPYEDDSSHKDGWTIELVEDHVTRYFCLWVSQCLEDLRAGGSPARVYGTKKIASAILYCDPVMWRSFSKPSILALPVLVSMSDHGTNGQVTYQC
jgi:hypothetical protein